MTKKASKSKKKKRAWGKGLQFTVEFTRRKLLFWSVVVFLSMVWMFTLGVLVGRGLSPVRFDMKRLKKDLVALKQRALKTDQTRPGSQTNQLTEDPELGFYEVLTDKKEDIRPKNKRVTGQTGNSEARAWGVSERGKTDKNIKPPRKLSEVRKDRRSLDKALTVRTPEADIVEEDLPLTIEVAFLRDAEEATQMVRLLQRKGYDAYSVALSLPEGAYHRVRVGHFSDSSEVSRVAARLKRDGFEVEVFRE